MSNTSCTTEILRHLRKSLIRIKSCKV